MLNDDFNRLIAAIRNLTVSVENLAFELSTKHSPKDTATLIEALAELSDVVDAASANQGEKECMERRN